VDELQAKIRTEKIAFARQMAMYLSRQLLGASLPKIGKEFGGRDHSTVIHACKKIASALKNNIEVSEAVKNISTSIKKFTSAHV
jgi:chromosomal replication initiator protein